MEEKLSSCWNGYDGLEQTSQSHGLH